MVAAVSHKSWIENNKFVCKNYSHQIYVESDSFMEAMKPDEREQSLGKPKPKILGHQRWRNRKGAGRVIMAEGKRESYATENGKIARSKG